MSLLNRIKGSNPKAARVLEDADLRTDADLRALTREDLRDLFPGMKEFKLRREIFDMIHQQRPFDALIRDLKAFIPQENLRAALTGNGVLLEYLHILKDMKTQMNNVQGFLDAHIGFLEENSKDQPHQESDKGGVAAMDQAYCGASPRCSTTSRNGYWSGISAPVVNRNDQTEDRQQETQVVYRVFVSGNTLGADQQLMDKVKNQCKNRVQFVESSVNHQVTVLFCAISTRIGSDVETALTNNKDDKPVILVMMNYTRKPQTTPVLGTQTESKNIVLHVHAFYHDTVNGLLTCDQNNAAASDVLQKLLQYRHPSGNDQVLHCESRGGVNGDSTRGNNRGSGGGGFYNLLSKRW